MHAGIADRCDRTAGSVASRGKPLAVYPEGADALRESWEVLRRRSRYIAQGLVDADDLLAGAAAATWEKWVKGSGPTSNVAAYVTQSMRNRLLDELKSPRSGVVPLDTTGTDPTYDDDQSRVDRHREYADIRAALRRLPAVQQQVLLDVVVDGRKPRDLEAEYQQSAPAISTVAYRAKKGLRSELFLHVIQGECSRDECALTQGRVARDLWKKAALSENCPQVSQLWQCQACAKGLRRYLDFSSMIAA